MTAASSQPLNTFLQMVFVSDEGKVMASALHEYPLNTGLVKDYIEKIYSASIRKRVALAKASEILQKQMKAWMSSFSAESGSVIAWRHSEYIFKLIILIRECAALIFLESNCNY